MSETLDSILMVGTTLTSGICFADFMKSLATYQASAEAITQKVYSTAQTINPEIVQKAHELVLQFADKPDYVSGILGVVSGICAIHFATLHNTHIYTVKEKKE